MFPSPTGNADLANVKGRSIIHATVRWRCQHEVAGDTSDCISIFQPPMDRKKKKCYQANVRRNLGFKMKCADKEKQTESMK